MHRLNNQDLKLKTEKEAENQWNSFEAKYRLLLPEIDIKRKTVYERTLSLEEQNNFKEAATKHIKQMISNGEIAANANLENAANTIQRFFTRSMGKDTLINVNANGNHSAQFRHLVNKQPVKRSLNQQKGKLLLSALKEGDWNNHIFTDATLPEIALSLFAANKITQQQIYSILEFNQAIVDYPLLQLIPLLDKDGQFTEIAKLFLTIDNGENFAKLSEEAIESLRLLILTLPLSERYFYLTNAEKLGELGLLLNKNKTLHTYNNQLLLMTAGLRDALGLCRFGEEEYVRMMLMMGKLTPSDIEKGIHANVRLGAIKFKGTDYGNIHEFTNVTGLEGTSHDDYHSKLMCCIPKNAIKGLWRLRELVRSATSIHISREIWQWTDCEYPILFGLNRFINEALDKSNLHSETDFITIKTNLTTFAFLMSLLYEPVRGYIFKLRFSNNIIAGRTPQLLARLTIHGILLILDMLKNPKDWAKLNIKPCLSPFELDIVFAVHESTQLKKGMSSVLEDTQQLYNELMKAYSHIEQIHEIIKDDPLSVQVLKCLVYRKLSGEDQRWNRDQFFGLIDSEVQEIAFKKVKKGDCEYADPEDNNTLVISYRNESDIKKIITLLRNKITDKTPQLSPLSIPILKPTTFPGNALIPQETQSPILPSLFTSIISTENFKETPLSYEERLHRRSVNTKNLEECKKHTKKFPEMAYKDLIEIGFSDQDLIGFKYTWTLHHLFNHISLLKMIILSHDDQSKKIFIKNMINLHPNKFMKMINDEVKDNHSPSLNAT